MKSIVPLSSSALIATVLIGVFAGSAKAELRFAGVSVAAPTASRVTVCHGFGCHYQSSAKFSANDLAKVAAIMKRGRKSPQAERAAIANAVQWFDRRFAKQIGTSVDIGGFDPQNSRKIGHQDCIDESVTTSGFLRLLAKNNLLKHHKVGRPKTRGFFLDFRYPHASAMIIEIASGGRFAVDPWPHKQGSKPDIMAYSDWMKIRPGQTTRAFASN